MGIPLNSYEGKADVYRELISLLHLFRTQTDSDGREVIDMSCLQISRMQKDFQMTHDAFATIHTVGDMGKSERTSAKFAKINQ